MWTAPAHPIPSDGDCDDADQIRLRPFCVGLTTSSTTALVSSANGEASDTIPASGTADTATGTALSCSTVATGNLAGMRMVGHLRAFDSPSAICSGG